MGEKDYVIQLRELVHQINSCIGPLYYATKTHLNEATRWEPPFSYQEEKQLLYYLIDKGREYIQLRRIASRNFLSKELSEKYFSLYSWFKSLQMLLDNYDVPLNKISFDDLSLKE